MNILVIGCGKIGSQLSNMLCQIGHDVAVIDSSAEHFNNLADNFTGYTVKGIPIDQDTLRRGGIEGCDAVVAVTEDDNMNVMVCQLAEEIFHVPRVLARIYDPRREGVFSRFGLRTVCPTNLSVSRILQILTDHSPIKDVCFDAASVAFDQVSPVGYQIGATLGALSRHNNARHTLFGLLRPDGNMLLSYENAMEVVAEGDRLIYATVVD